MSGGLSPRFSFSRRLHGIAYVFAIPQRGFAEQPAIRATHFHAVPGIRPLLLPADKKLHGTVDRRRDNIGVLTRRLIQRQRIGLELRSILEPRRLQIFQKPFPAALPPKATFAIAAKSARGVKQIRAVDP